MMGYTFQVENCLSEGHWDLGQMNAWPAECTVHPASGHRQVPPESTAFIKSLLGSSKH